LKGLEQQPGKSTLRHFSGLIKNVSFHDYSMLKLLQLNFFIVNMMKNNGVDLEFS